MPYPFAHPAAVLPLARPLGRFAVPSALAIGSMAPDFWYFVPLLERDESHSLVGLAWFCLPAGLLAYALFHLLLKQPLIALLSPRLGCFTPAGLPQVPWRAVIVSLMVGALTHLVWDALTHSYDEAAQRQAYHRVRNVMIPYMYYRDDIGERWSEDSDRLHAWGYLRES